MPATDITCDNLRVALFSGNYNYVRDGANQALNRLVGYLLRQGAQVRVYSPTIAEPAFAPTGDLVSLPSVAIPGRDEYRFPLGLSASVRQDLERFAPNLVHVSSPDISSHRAVTWARNRRLPVVASVHTRFETYFRYYNLSWFEPIMEAILRRFYQRCDALVAPSDSFVEVLRNQGMNADIGLWSRGIDRDQFHAGRRDMAWRRSLGFADDDFVIGFHSRLVMEKGLDTFADTIDELRRRGVAHRVLIIGDGPARGFLDSRLPDAVFAGFQAGADLARGVASMDALFFPSITETFGNVTLEAMACRLPVVAAAAAGSLSLVVEGETGYLVPPGEINGFADAIARYGSDPALRQRHGAAGEERSRAYSWDAINQAVVDTYLRILNQRKAA